MQNFCILTNIPLISKCFSHIINNNYDPHHTKKISLWLPLVRKVYFAFLKLLMVENITFDSRQYLQGITFEASDRSCSLLLSQINNHGSDLSFASIAKIAHCMQVFVLTRSFLSIRFTRKVYPLYNEVFGLQ